MSCVAVRRQAGGGGGPEGRAHACTTRNAEVVDVVIVDGVAARLPSSGTVGVVPLPVALLVVKATRAVRGQVQNAAVNN